MSETEHDRWRDELAAYLLGALEPGEAAELERHLAGCEDAAPSCDWLRPAVQLLPETVERVEPPPELREQVMARCAPSAERAAAPEARRRSPRCRRLGGWRPLAGARRGRPDRRRVAGYAIRDGGSGGGGADAPSSPARRRA